VSDPNKIALIIGVDKYKSGLLDTLPSSKKDALDMHKLLHDELDYTVFDDKVFIGSELNEKFGWADIREAITRFYFIFQGMGSLGVMMCILQLHKLIRMNLFQRGLLHRR
jgi:hypothetical protein